MHGGIQCGAGDLNWPFPPAAERVRAQVAKPGHQSERRAPLQRAPRPLADPPARELPKADIARLTGLSPQTISIITNQLTADGLLLKGNPQRGRIGQPSVPYSLNPEGALAFGLKVGRRSVDLYLIDFTGRILKALHKTYTYPTLAAIRRFTSDGIEEVLAALKPALAARIAGLGIGAPYEMWTWHEEIGAPPRSSTFGAPSTFAARSLRSAPGRCISPTTSPPPAPPS